MTAARLRRRLRDESGLTLMELVVVMPMLTVLLGGLVFMLTTTMHQNARTQEQSTLQTEARAALGTLVADLRQAYLGTGSAISSASQTSITFYSPDRQPSFHLRKISYQLSGGTLERSLATSTNVYPTGPPWTFGAAGPWITQLGSITNTDVFTYYDDTGTVLTSPIDVSEIRSVAVNLTVTTGGQQPQLTTFSDTATLRST